MQSHDLNHTGTYVDAVLSNEKPIPPPQPQKISSPSKASEAKTRFSEPPAPPPSQPLPEKPDGGVRSKLAELPALQPILRRSDTEKPRALHETMDEYPTNVEHGPQIVGLVEALTTAQKEIVNQRERLKHMEDALKQEQKARNAAEERAKRPGLEPQPAKALRRDGDSTGAPEDQVSTTTEVADSDDVKQRFDLMRMEMDNMRQEMELYRQRTEVAEQDSRRDRESLAEMVARIRRRDAAAEKRKDLRSRRQAADSSDTEKHEEEPELEKATDKNLEQDLDDDLEAADEHLNGHVDSIVSKQLASIPEHRLRNEYSNGQVPWSTGALKRMSRPQLEELAKAVNAAAGTLGSMDGSHGMVVSRSATQDRLVQSAPYASMVGVVIVGVSLMAYLNGWSKGVVGER